MSTYTISFDEFLELFQESLPKASIASFVATIFIAVALGAFGAVLTYAIDPGSKLVASTFCWMSLALFVAAFWDLTLRTRKRRARAVRELRTVYEKYYSGERTLTFDVEKWAIQGPSGRQESLWSGLLTATEKQNIILLSSQNQISVGIPKRVLGAQELDSLRQVALKKGEHTWRSRVSLLDFLLTAVPSLWRQHPFLMTEAHVAGMFFYVMISSTMLHERGPGVFVGWIFAWLILFLTVTAQFWYFFIKYKTSHKALQSFWDVAFSNAGINIRTADSDSFRAWTSFTKATETARCFLLNVGSSRYFIFPKNCMRIDQKENVRRLLQVKLPARQD